MSNFKKISPNISELIIRNPKTKYSIKWINIVNAGKPEIDFLKKNYKFNLAHLHASIASVFSQRPMIASESGYVFMISGSNYRRRDRIFYWAWLFNYGS